MNTPAAAEPHGRFPTTHWSIVLNAGASSASQAREALEALCVQYWYPLYSFLRRQGRPHHEAEDCTQEFFARLLARGVIARAEPQRGRFRTFLLTSLRNFLTNEWERSRAAKRGGGQPLLSLDCEGAEQRFAREPVDPGLTPEQAYNRAWALSLIDRVVAELRLEYERDGRGATFAALIPFVWGDGTAGTTQHAAEQLGLSANAVAAAVHRLRLRVGERLRERVIQTVHDEAEAVAELRELIAAVGQR